MQSLNVKNHYDQMCRRTFIALSTGLASNTVLAQTLPTLNIPGVSGSENPIESGMALVYIALYYVLIAIGLASIGLAAYLIFNEAKKPEKADDNRWLRVFGALLGGLFIIVAVWWLVDWGVDIIPATYRGF